MKFYGEYIPHDKCLGLVNHARMLTAFFGSTYMYVRAIVHQDELCQVQDSDATK